MRSLVPIFSAFLVTLALFYLMQHLIAVDGQRIERNRSLASVSLVRALPGRPSPEAGGGETAAKRTLPQQPAEPGPPPSIPDLAFAELPVPVSPPLQAVMPELARIAPGGKPYLGDFVRPAKKVPPTVKQQKPQAAQPAKKKKPVKRRSTPKGAKALAKSRPAPSSSRRSSADKAATSGAGKSKTGTKGKAKKSTKGSGRGKGGGSGRGKKGGGGGVREAVAIRKPPPVYPRKAAKTGQEGWVKVEFTVTTDGKVKDPKVVSSRPRRVFDRSALKAISRWRFRPRTVDGKPVTRRVTQVIDFKLSKR